MAFGDVVARELHAGLPRLKGTQVTGHVPVRQAVLNDLLGRMPGAPQDLRLEIGGDNEIVARYGILRFTARVHPAVEFLPRPTLMVELASRVAAFALQRARVPPFVRVRGRLIAIDLSAVPALRGAAGVWPHVQRLEVVSRAGRLDLLFTVHIA